MSQGHLTSPRCHGHEVRPWLPLGCQVPTVLMRQCLALPEMHGILPTRPTSAGHLLMPLGLIAPCSWP